jgi:hypothetical protein
MFRAGFEPDQGRGSPNRASQLMAALAFGIDGTCIQRLKTGANQSKQIATSLARRVFRPTDFSFRIWGSFGGDLLELLELLGLLELLRFLWHLTGGCSV